MFETFEVHQASFTISTDPARLQIEVIVAALRDSYWANQRSRDVIEQSLEHSLCFGVYHGEHQVGLARVITDYATFAYLCDVFILESERGHGLGRWLMQTVMTHPELQGLRRWMLATRDAHGLYAQYGFTALPAPERWMERFNPNA
jgi:GNAT superfamily N-acetyltransferase